MLDSENESGVSEGRSRSWNSGSPLLPLVLCALAAGLCLLRLGEHSVWLDEGYSIGAAQLPLGVLVSTHPDANMLLYYVGLNLWLALGDSESTIRLLSVMFAVASVAALYAIAQQLFDRRVAVVACLLLMATGSFVHYAQEARSYSLTLLLVCLSWLGFINVIRKRSWAWALLWGATTALLCYAHLIGVLMLPAQLVSLALLDRRTLPWRRLTAGAATAAVGLLPLAALVHAQGTGQINWVPPLNRHELTETALLLTGGSTVSGWPRLLAGVLYLALWAAAVAMTLRRKRDVGERWGSWLALSWLVVPLSILVGLSLMKPMLVPRYALGGLPAGALLAAIALTRLRAAVAAPVLVALLGLSAVGVIGWFKDDDQRWRSATGYVLSATRSGDGIAFFSQQSRGSFQYYWEQAGRPDVPVPLAPKQSWQSRRPMFFAPTSSSEVAARTRGRARVWVMLGRSAQGRFRPGPGEAGLSVARLRTSRREASRFSRSLHSTHVLNTERDFGQLRVQLFTRRRPDRQ